MNKTDFNPFLLIFLILLIIVSAFPQFNQELFVHPSGKFGSGELTTGILLSLLIFFKWKYVKIFYYVLIGLFVFLEINILSHFSNKYFVSHLLFLLSHISLLLVFIFSKNIQYHVARKVIINNEIDFKK